MPDDSLAHWTVSVSKSTDSAVRSFLADRGLDEGDLSGFIEDAVKWRVFDQTITEARSRFSDLPPDELQTLIGEAVTAARKTGAPAPD